MSLIKRILNFKNSFFHNHGKNNHVFIIDNNGNRSEIHRLKNSRIKFKGDNNIIEIHKPLSCLALNITVCNNTTIILHPSVYPRNISITGFNNDGNTIIFGRNLSTTGNIQISLLRGNGNIQIGEDCMFAYNITIQMGDGHAIYSNTTNTIINNNRDIIVGNHVWVATDVLLLKGSQIPDNSVVGIKSIVTKQFTQPNTIIAGTPASIVKQDIYWTRESQY